MKLAGAPHWLLTMTLCRGWYLRNTMMMGKSGTCKEAGGQIFDEVLPQLHGYALQE